MTIHIHGNPDAEQANDADPAECDVSFQEQGELDAGPTTVTVAPVGLATAVEREMVTISMDVLKTIQDRMVRAENAVYTAFMQCAAQARKLDTGRQILTKQIEFISQFTRERSGLMSNQGGITLSEPRVLPSRNLEAAEAPSVVPKRAPNTKTTGPDRLPIGMRRNCEKQLRFATRQGQQLRKDCLKKYVSWFPESREEDDEFQFRRDNPDSYIRCA